MPARFEQSAPTISPQSRSSALIERNPNVDWAELDDVILGCANQAGEDNRNLARMAGLLAGLPDSSGGVTFNRLCGSGLDAVAMAARAIRGGEDELIIAGGSESMSRAPFVMAKASQAFDRNAEMYDTTIGWRFVNPKMKAAYGDDTMPSTGENVAQEFQVSRDDQDAFALRSQEKAARAQANGRLAAEIVAVEIPQRKGDPLIVDKDEHPRATTLEALGEAEADRARRRHRDRRQRLGRQRWRGGDHHRLGRSGQAQRPDAEARGCSAPPSPASRRASWASAPPPRARS